MRSLNSKPGFREMVRGQMNLFKFKQMAMVACVVVSAVGCGDNLEAPFPQGASAGSAGSGSPPILPPDGGSGAGGTAGSGVTADAGTCVPGATCTMGVATKCLVGGVEYDCICGYLAPSSLKDKLQCADAGTAGSAGAATGGAAGSGGSSTGGSSGTGGAATGGSSTGGAAGSGGTSTAPECDDGVFAHPCTHEGGNSAISKMTCKCGVCLPDGMAKQMVCVTDGGTAGSGGAGGSGGTAGSGGSSTGGSSGTGGAATGGSSTGGAAGSGGSNPVLGVLEITVVPPTSGSHDITLITNCTNCQAGENAASNTHVVATRIVQSLDSYEGSVRKVNGYYDPPSGQSVWTHQLCDPQKLTLTATVWAKFNGQDVGKPTVVSNGQNGCDLIITAKALQSDYMDEDGDGDPMNSDCNDYDPRLFHGQIETPDDQIDFDCDGNINPLRVAIRLYENSGFAPTLTDYGHSGITYPMTYSGNGYYEVKILKALAPTDFNIQYGSNWDVGYWSGSCHRLANVTITLESVNTPYTVNMTQVGNPAYTCHDSVVY